MLRVSLASCRGSHRTIVQCLESACAVHHTTICISQLEKVDCMAKWLVRHNLVRVTYDIALMELVYLCWGWVART